MIRSRCNCKLCSLATSKRVHCEPGHSPKLMIIGECPGQDEELQGKPFVGTTGRLLGWAFKETGLYRPGIWMSNAILCRPPKGDMNHLEGLDAQLCCKPGLLEEIDAAAKAGVTTLLVLGSNAAKIIGLSGQLEKIRGSVYELKTLSGLVVHAIPTYHPATIMAQHWKRSGGGTADNGVLWLADFRKARDLSENGWKTLREDFNLNPVLADVVQFVSKAIANNSLVAIDTETTGLDRDYAEIVVIGLATGPETGLSVPILTTDGQSYWSIPEWHIVKAELNRLFSTCDQLYQNCFFDVPLLRKHGFTVPSEKILHDTIMLHHTLAAEAKHDLGTIVSLYGQTPFWKAEFSDRTTTILKMDQQVMRRYNLRDCVVLHQVLPAMLKDLQELNLADFYHAEVQPLVACIMELNENGITFDPLAQKKFKASLETNVNTRRAKLLSDMSLPGLFNLESDDQLRWFLFGVEPSTFKMLEDLPKKKPGTAIHAQLTALQAVKDRGQFYQLKGWRAPVTASGKISIDKQGMLAFQIQLNNRRSEIADKPKFADELATIQQLQAWLDDLSEFNRLAKCLSTNTSYKPSLDGRIRSRWLMHGTVSGRVASREPNLMNIPTGKDDPTDPATQIRNFFVARPGWHLVSCDYVNLEAQLLAYETQDPGLVKVFTQKLNLHDLNTKSMFKIDATHPLWDSARAAAKVFFFGGISYGGGDRSIFEKVWLKAPKLQLTFADFVKLKDNWMADHPAYVKWKEQLIAQVLKDRELRTEFGRFRQFLSNDADIGREALDFKIQSSGASLVNRAMVRIAKERDRLGLSALFVLQVHDQLVMECPPEELDTVKALIVTEMERPFMYKETERRIPVEVSVGRTFGDV